MWKYKGRIYPAGNGGVYATKQEVEFLVKYYSKDPWVLHTKKKYPGIKLIASKFINY